MLWIDKDTYELPQRWMLAKRGIPEGVEDAEDEATEALEREAIRRAVEGTDEPVHFNGQKAGSKSRRPEICGERYYARLTANLNAQSAVKVVHE